MSGDRRYDVVPAAAEAIMRAQNASDDDPERWEARMLAEAALEAAAPAIAAQAVAAERERIRRKVGGPLSEDDLGPLEDDEHAMGWAAGRIYERQRTLGIIGGAQ